MDDPKISSKDMKILKLREKNLLEMIEEGMEEFSEGGAVVPKKYKDGGAVRKKKGKGKKSGYSCRGAGAAVKGTRFSGVK